MSENHLGHGEHTAQTPWAQTPPTAVGAPTPPTGAGAPTPPTAAGAPTPWAQTPPTAVGAQTPWAPTPPADAGAQTTSTTPVVGNDFPAAPPSPWAQPTPYSVGPAWPPPPQPVPQAPPAAGSPEPPRPGTWRRAGIATVAAVAIALTAGGVGGFVGYAMHGDTDNTPLQSTATATGNTAPVVDRSSLAKIAAEIQPTVVDIVTGTGEGSGVIISADGYIVTNNHVVSGVAQGASVKVTFNSGKQVTAKVVGTDPKTDLAVVKADATGLKFASWADSDSVQVGDTVLAVGSPLGLQGSVTAGIVSALHRTITVGGNEQQSPFGSSANGATTTIGDALQTDAPINPGNSGGALVNTEGKVVGINSAIATSGSNGNIGVGFAISANKAKSVAEQLIKGGKVSHPFLGVSVGNGDNGGAQIQQVTSGGPADKAGLRAGDVVTKVNDRAIAGSDALVGAIQASSVGSELKLTVTRDGSETTVTVTVGEAP